MKALTLHQPWASLIALGVKTIETRSWATRYRGPLAIHAGAKVPLDGQRLGPQRDVVTEEFVVSSEGRDVPLLLDLCNEEAHPLPLGTIVATCTLVDVVPMQSFAQHSHDGPHLLVEPGCELVIWAPGARTIVEDQRPYGDFAPGRYAWLLEDAKPTSERCPACLGEGIGSVCPDSGTGRSACDGSGRREPVAAKGRQGLWRWTP